MLQVRHPIKNYTLLCSNNKLFIFKAKSESVQQIMVTQQMKMSLKR